MAVFARLMHTPCLALRAAMGVAGALALLCAGPALAQNKAPALSHEQQLQAIRQALLETTLETAPTQVISSAWIDGQGALHESHEFHARAEVRGVRVLSYLQDGQEPKARVSAEVLPWSWRPGRDQAKPCTPPARTLRLPMALRTELAPGFPGDQQAAAHTLLASARSDWSGLVQQAQRWIPTEASPPQVNSYQRALLAAPTATASGWVATLVLRPAPATEATWLTPAQWRWTLSLQIAQAGAGAAPSQKVADEAFEITLDPLTVAQHPRRWQHPLQSELQAHLAGWLQKFDAQTRCEPVQFTVQRDELSPALKLQAGAASGLRAGDRVLLLQPGWVPSRILDPRAVDHLALAEVVQTGPRQTDLRQLAGPPLARQGEWIAMPL